MDALQWMGAVRMRADKNITIIHSTPVHQLTSGEDKRWNKSSIFWLKYESIIYNNSSSSEKVFWSESGEKSASDQAAFKTVQNSSKQICVWILMWETTADALFHWRKSYYGLWTHILVQKCWNCFSFCLLQMLTDGLECCGLLWCFYQNLILTAPIHCRPSIAETLMQRHISTNLMKTQTHPDLRWTGWAH